MNNVYIVFLKDVYIGAYSSYDNAEKRLMHIANRSGLNPMQYRVLLKEYGFTIDRHMVDSDIEAISDQLEEWQGERL